MELIIKRLWLLVVMLVILEGWWCCDGCLEHERNALLQIKASFNHPNGISLTSWVKHGNCCKWHAIQCNVSTGRVFEIDLSYTRDWTLGYWYLNASLFLPFKELNVLSLFGNHITGCVENEGFERLSILRNLEFFDLSYNKFNKNILSSLGGLLSLKSLRLHNNSLKGLINIGELNNLTNLEELDIGSNKIEGFQSLQDVRGLSNLKTLYLDDLNINGTSLLLKQSLRIFPNLRTLYLGGNNFEGATFPQEKGFFNLQELYLDGSSMDENFVWSIGALHSLKTLSMTYLNGTVSIEGKLQLRIFPNLRTLHLEGNNLEGTTFPQEKGFINLQELYLDRSSIDENFVRSLGALHSLKKLSMFSINGTVPIEGLLNLHKLEMLDLEGNQNLDSNILQKIGAMSSLKTLYLSYCGLNGTLPVIGGLCALKHLQGLAISNNNFSGNLPWCLANLTSLQFLDPSENSFSGNISLSPLTSLISIEGLWLGGNQFQIPFSLGPFFNHSKLKVVDDWGNEIFAETKVHNLIPKFQLNTLYLDDHGYGGPFPKFLYHQHDLIDVEFCNFGIHGEFPYWLLDNNTKLRRLYLVNTSLTGPLQLPIHHHLQLYELDISNNRFNGQVPTKFGAYFSKLKFLNMSANDFQGSIPISFGNMSSLQWLQINDNQFIGGISNSLSKCYSLIMLDASNNHLSKAGWMGNLSSLEVLDLSYNIISGILPSKFAPPKIREIHFSNNGLRGLFPHALFICTELTILDISHNNLTNSIPDWIGRFSQLNFLLLSHNNLDGELPIQLCNLDKLCFTDLSNNNLSGHILPCLKSSSMWYRGDFSSCIDIFGPMGLEHTVLFSEQILEFITKSTSYSYHGFILELISGIDLSSNNFIGEIPQKIGNLVDIKFLNLSHNSLTGPIPPSFSNLSQILSLDLSYNKLTGTIPPQLTQLSFLEVFSVAHNNLSGRTPERVAQFATFEESSYKENPLLCGPPLPRSCTAALPPSPTQHVNNDEEESNSFMDIDAFYVTFVVTYIIVLFAIAVILCINPTWRQAWFYFIEVSINSCYYFVVDNLPVPSRFRLLKPI